MPHTACVMLPVQKTPQVLVKANQALPGKITSAVLPLMLK